MDNQDDRFKADVAQLIADLTNSAKKLAEELDDRLFNLCASSQKEAKRLRQENTTLRCEYEALRAKFKQMRDEKNEVDMKLEDTERELRAARQLIQQSQTQAQMNHRSRRAFSEAQETVNEPIPPVRMENFARPAPPFVRPAAPRRAAAPPAKRATVSSPEAAKKRTRRQERSVSRVSSPEISSLVPFIRPVVDVPTGAQETQAGRSGRGRRAVSSTGSSALKKRKQAAEATHSGISQALTQETDPVSEEILPVASFAQESGQEELRTVEQPGEGVEANEAVDALTCKRCKKTMKHPRSLARHYNRNKCKTR